MDKGVILITMIRFLTALAVQNGRTLQQADCKFAFIQASLPPEEHTIAKPQLGYPFSKPHQYWRLKNLFMDSDGPHGIGTTNSAQFLNRLKLVYNLAPMTRVYSMVH